MLDQLGDQMNGRANYLTVWPARAPSRHVTKPVLTIAAPFGSTLHDVDLGLFSVSSALVYLRASRTPVSAFATCKMYRTVPRMAGYVSLCIPYDSTLPAQSRMLVDGLPAVFAA